MMIDELGRQYLETLRLGGCADSTFSTYQSWLRHYIVWLVDAGHKEPDVDRHFTVPTLKKYQGWLMETKQYRPRSVRSAFFVLRGMGDYLVELGLVPENPARKLIMPKLDDPDRPLVSDEEVVQLLAATERSRSPKRVALAKALISSLAFTGARASEIMAIRLKDVRPEQKTLTIVHGKGAKTRILYPPQEWFDAVREWRCFRDKEESPDNPWLWATFRSRKVSYNGLLGILAEVKLIAGLGDADHIAPHAFRRGFSQRLLRNGATLTQIQSTLGHADVQTTFVYLGGDTQPGKVMADLASLAPRTQAQVPVQATTPLRADHVRRMRRRT